MGYSTAEITCSGCMGPCGMCQEFLTEQVYITYQLQKMEDSELEAELRYITFQVGARMGQLFTLKHGSALTIGMIKSDLITLLDRFEAVRQEMERRVIP